MRSNNLNRHKKRHDKPVEIEPLQSVALTNESYPSVNDSFYKPTNMDKEILLKKMLKFDMEYKEKMEMGEQMYEYVKEYDIDKKSLPKAMREPLEIYKEHKQTVDIENVILKSWQESLLNYMKP